MILLQPRYIFRLLICNFRWHIFSWAIFQTSTSFISCEKVHCNFYQYFFNYINLIFLFSIHLSNSYRLFEKIGTYSITQNYTSIKYLVPNILRTYNIFNVAFHWLQVEAGLVVKWDVAMGDSTTGGIMKQDVKARGQWRNLKRRYHIRNHQKTRRHGEGA